MAGGSTGAVWAAMVANAIIAVAKFVAAGVTGSSAMFSEGIHSVADTGNQALLLFGDRRSRKPADRRHPFGYGPEMYFWSLIVAMILFGLGGGFSLYEGIAHLDHPTVPGDPTWNYWVLGIAFVVEAVALKVALDHLMAGDRGPGLWRRLRASKDPRVYVPVAEDAAALLGVVVAFLGVFLARRLGAPVLDAVASIVIGCILAGVAVFLAAETRALMVGESIVGELEERIRAACAADPAVVEVVQMRGIHLSPDEVLLALELRFAAGEAEGPVGEVVDRIERRVKEVDPRLTRVLVEPAARRAPAAEAG